MSIRSEREPACSKEELAVLLDIPIDEIGGFIIITLTKDGSPLRCSADTADVGELIYVLAHVIGGLGLDLRGMVEVEHQ